ncbi:lipoamide acyltransferase component ofbranched-chain alpha-keto acid dehydrogenase [Striga asiatica]|uniref:Lipoamide acyltransferase component ofbranched-chain alpha-keto acid dehydrogenase n=1 Tax=Striga asiatica TaxID=4170 RepID=A0A5A7Q8Y5_STRAF|nr:lipoamide acyltransferase component ofbranched-chain alpha-keto acid dehydrogenase [Striga asiatica]
MNLSPRSAYDPAAPAGGASPLPPAPIQFRLCLPQRRRRVLNSMVELHIGSTAGRILEKRLDGEESKEQESSHGAKPDTPVHKSAGSESQPKQDSNLRLTNISEHVGEAPQPIGDQQLFLALVPSPSHLPLNTQSETNVMDIGEDSSQLLGNKIDTLMVKYQKRKGWKMKSKVLNDVVAGFPQKTERGVREVYWGEGF